MVASKCFMYEIKQKIGDLTIEELGEEDFDQDPWGL